MRKDNFENARVGMDFSVDFGDGAYETSVMMIREKGICEIFLNHELKYSSSPDWMWNCFVQNLELDGHSFLIVLQRNRVRSDEYTFYCFADGISVTDGKTTLAEFRKKWIHFPWGRYVKDFLHYPIGFWLSLCGAWFYFFLEVESEMLSDRMIKASITLAKLIVLFIGFSFASNFAQYVGNRSKLLKMLDDQIK